MHCGQFTIILCVASLASASAKAEIWRWVDVNGEIHYVDSNRPIYTWLDNSGEVHYSDKPDHAAAVKVVLEWHSDQDLDALQQAGELADGGQQPEMTKEEYCSNAREIYASYLAAPQLFKTGANGARSFLSVEETAATLAATKAKVEELCN